MAEFTETKADKGRRRRAIIIIIMGALLSFTAFQIAGAVSAQIIQGNILAMEELALHDERSIENSLSLRWAELDRIGAQLQTRGFTDAADVSEKLRNVDGGVTSADFLMLIADDGTEYRSTGLIHVNPELNEILKNYDTRFVFRYNEVRFGWKENRKEMLVMGVPVDIAGPDTHFRWLMCRLGISTLETELKIDSYRGEGFSSVIDMEGNYIINVGRSHSIGTYDNFSRDLEAARFEGYNSIEEVRTAIRAGKAHSVIYTMPDGTENVMVITAMNFVDWYFVTTVPLSVFDVQTNRIMTSFFMLLGVVIIVFLLLFFLAARQRNQKELLKIAEAENKAKTSFLFNMSHDIRTPMNAILGFTDIALNHLHDTERVADSLTKIKSSGALLLSLINDILEMSRIEAGKLDIAEAPVDMLRAWDGINPMVESLAMAKSIEYSYSADGITDRYVYADMQHLDRVLVNILTNAVKYTKPGGRVSFTVAQDSAARDGVADYRFVISDTGVGMPKDFVENELYHRFSREKTSTLSRQQGTGLGLAIAKRIVDSLGGTIEVESEVGKGTTFTVSISLRLQSQADIEQNRMHAEAALSHESALALHGKKALLVEDNELNREIATEILADAGLTVDAAEDGALAVDAIREKGAAYYDFVLMDIQMPVMDGYEATKKIRALPEGDKVKIIALSANAFTEDRKKSEAAGMNDHIAKPIDIDELLRALMKCLR